MSNANGLAPRIAGRMWGLLLVLAGACCGCGQTANPTSETGQDRFTVERVSIQTPLTVADVETFVNIVARLPGQAVPDFVLAPPRPVRAEHLQADLLELQQRCRALVDPIQQGNSWHGDVTLRRRFEELGVDPHAFAALTVRISSAWFRMSFDSSADVKGIRLQLDSQLKQSLARIQQVSLRADDCELLIQQIQEGVCLRELLSLLETMPIESVQTVAACRQQLRPLLPAASPIARFDRLIESTPKVIQVSR